MAEPRPKKPSFFLIIPIRSEFRRIREAVSTAAREAGVTQVITDEVILHRPVTDSFASEIARADFVVADVSDASPYLFYELGLAQALGKTTVILRNADASPQPIPFDVSDLPIITYKDDHSGVAELERQLRRSFSRIRQSPSRFRSLRRVGAVIPRFTVDWQRLDPRDFENLCMELLLQLGFRNVEWGKEMRGIDATAVLQKTDPDGHEYREIWVVAMGTQMPIELAAEMILGDQFILSDRIEKMIGSGKLHGDAAEIPATLLLIPNPRESPPSAEWEEHLLRRTRRFMSRRVSVSLRVRIWDRQYLTRLVTQHSQIGYKYFSDEIRAVSRYRKTPEEMYQEIAQLNDRLQTTIATLEQERSMRVRAERDAVWKDLSFTAAHKLGNPIFAVETYLGPLSRRITVDNNSAALAILERIAASVEEAKSIIQQFKSLTKAQEITLAPFDLREVLESACHVAQSGGVNVRIALPESLPKIMGDAARLSECFSELVANAHHWYDKSTRQLTVEAAIVGGGGKLPDGLTASRYICVHFQDNGVGVPVENKERIFDAFFTTYHHGTGLGLSVVRRIIEGHGGIVREIGILGEGADFELFLPVVEDKPVPTRRGKD